MVQLMTISRLICAEMRYDFLIDLPWNMGIDSRLKWMSAEYILNNPDT